MNYYKNWYPPLFWTGDLPILGEHQWVWGCWFDAEKDIIETLGVMEEKKHETTWWLIPLSKWVITPVINGISRVNPLITGVITHLRAVGWATNQRPEVVVGNARGWNPGIPGVKGTHARGYLQSMDRISWPDLISGQFRSWPQASSTSWANKLYIYI